MSNTYSTSTNCFKSGVVYTFVDSVALQVAQKMRGDTRADLKSHASVKVVFDTFDDFMLALNNSGDAVRTARIVCELASYPLAIRNTFPWQKALLDPENTLFFAFCVASGSKDPSPEIVAVTCVGALPIDTKPC